MDLKVGDYTVSLSKAMNEIRSLPVAIADFTDVFYIQAARY
jgi:hypothetical protein